MAFFGLHAGARMVHYPFFDGDRFNVQGLADAGSYWHSDVSYKTRPSRASMLSKNGSFVGQHVYTSRPGVAVQINAFNFPVWGMLEKLAPAFIAGLPSIVKPASQTAYLTELVVRRIIESGILPEGSLQLLSGSAGDLLDHLAVQDSVAFTGSAHTAGILRQHPSVLHGGVQLQVEADSLNCAILAPDVGPDDESLLAGVAEEQGVECRQQNHEQGGILFPRNSSEGI